MIEKLKTINPYDETEIDMDTNSVAGLVYENTPLIQKINELVDVVNGILAAQEQYATIYNEDIVPMLTPENKAPTDPYTEQRKMPSLTEKDAAMERVFNLRQELERTRKALDKAKWWLNEIVENHRCTPISTAEMALKEITAIEQKDK